MKTSTPRPLLTGLACLCCIASLLISEPSKADVPADGYYTVSTDQLMTSNASAHPWFTIENGRLTKASGMLYNPVCKDGKVQTPAPITDLAAFFDGDPHTRVIDRGNGNYLLASSNDMKQHHNFHHNGTGVLNNLYGELDFNSPTQGTFTMHVSMSYYNSEGIGTSTCLARREYELNRVNS